MPTLRFPSRSLPSAKKFTPRFLSLAMVVLATFVLCLTTRADSFERLPLQVVSVVDCDAAVDVVAGNAAYGSAVRAFLWSNANGLVIVGTRGSSSSARAVSADGTTAVGSFVKEGNTSAFLWKKPVGCVDIGGLGGDHSVANDVSTTGNIIVGEARNADGELRAFRATFDQALNQDLVDLGTLGGLESQALFVSGDGQVVVGRSRVAGGAWHVFQWTGADGMIDLGSLGGDILFVEDATEDGSIVVGSAENEEGVFVPFMATEADGTRRVVNVGDVPGSAAVVSGDGAFIFGQAQLEGTAETQAFRTRLPSFSLLPLGGLVPNGASFVSSASDDGKVIGGAAENKNGKLQAYLRVQGVEKGKPTSLDRILNKVFENDVLPTLRFVDVPCLSTDGKTLVGQATVKGTSDVAFVRVQIDAYPPIINQRYFYTRPYSAEIASYVQLTADYTQAMVDAYGTGGFVGYADAFADAAVAYQELCAALVIDGINDAATEAQYLEYRANAATNSYYAYFYAYYGVYLPSGGTAVSSGDASTYAYYAYYYQQADLDELTATE